MLSTDEKQKYRGHLERMLSLLDANQDDIFQQELDVWINTHQQHLHQELGRMAREAIYGQLERMVAEADSPVESAIRLSALGNILDFAIIDPSKIDIQKEVAAAADLIFERYDDGPFFSILSRARQVLILGDNAGEIVFDKLLAKTLKAFKPGLTVTYAVRHRPVLNDITLEEARDIGMDEVAEVISSGSLAPGTCLDETTSEFNALFESADLVIAKGQGNYETLNAAPRENLFFIFRVKCKQVAETMNAPLHSLVLLKS